MPSTFRPYNLPYTPGPPNRACEQDHLSHDSTARNPSYQMRSNRNFDDLDNNELCVLATMALNTIRQCGIPHIFPISTLQPKQPDIFENTKIEQIICSGLKPLYDGAPDKLLALLILV